MSNKNKQIINIALLKAVINDYKFKKCHLGISKKLLNKISN